MSIPIHHLPNKSSATAATCPTCRNLVITEYSKMAVESIRSSEDRCCIEKLEGEKAEMLEVIADLVGQSCGIEGDKIDSMALTAYASAIRLLALYGLVEIETDVSRRVIGKWVKP